MKILMTLFLAVAAFGCGKDGAPGASSAYQSGSDRCSVTFVSNFNQANTLVLLAEDASDLDSAENFVNQFESEYKGVNCRAEVADPDSVASNGSHTNADKQVEKWKAEISSTRKDFRSGTVQSKYPGPANAYRGNSQNCSTDFVDDYNEIQTEAQSDTSTKKELKSIISKFSKKYEDAECYLSFKGSRSLINVNELMVKLTEILE